MVQGEHKPEVAVDMSQSQAEPKHTKSPETILAAIAEQRKTTLWFLQILADQLSAAAVPTVQLVRPIVPRLQWLCALTGRQLQAELLATGWNVVHGWRPYGIEEGRPHFIRQGLFISQQDRHVFQYLAFAEPPALGLDAAAQNCRQLPIVAYRQFGQDPDSDFILWKYPPAGNPLDCREPYRDIFWDAPEARHKAVLDHGLEVEAALQHHIEHLASSCA